MIVYLSNENDFQFTMNGQKLSNLIALEKNLIEFLYNGLKNGNAYFVKKKLYTHLAWFVNRFGPFDSFIA